MFKMPPLVLVLLIACKNMSKRNLNIAINFWLFYITCSVKIKLTWELNHLNTSNFKLNPINIKNILAWLLFL